MDSKNYKLHELIEASANVKVYIASSRPSSSKIGSGLIMWYQKTNYSHVLIIVNDVVFQASHGSVNAFYIDEFLKENIIVDKIQVQNSICDFYFMLSTLGRKYSFIQLCKIATKFILLTKFKIIKKYKYKDNGSQVFICSEYVGRFLKLDWVNDLTDPREIIDYLTHPANNSKVQLTCTDT